MTRLSLYAERECSSAKLMGTFTSKADAAAAVERMEEQGTWPEGSDAVLLAPEGKLVYVDGWEPVDGQEEES